MTARFKLVSGKHLEARVRYKTGDIVESGHDLAKLFGAKFQYIDGDAKAPQAEQDRIDSIPRNQSAPSASETVTVAVPKPKVAVSTSTKNIVVDREPKDVTEQFETAVLSTLVVHKIGRKYWVKEPQTDDYLNDDGLNKAQTIGFIEEYMDVE